MRPLYDCDSGNSRFEWLSPDQLEQPATRAGFALWNTLRGNRPFPRRDDLKPRTFAILLPNMILVRVIDGGRDFEHRIVGDAVVRAFRTKIQNRTFSDIARCEPHMITVRMPIYRTVIETRQPFAWRGRIGTDGTANFCFHAHEAVLLPLGQAEGAVDHVLSFGVFDTRLHSA